MEFDNLNERHDAPFKREHCWYRGKTDYEPYVGERGCSGGEFWGWAGVFVPNMKTPFVPIDAKDIVAVQPMAVPSSLAFYESFRTDTDVNNLDKRKLLR